MLGLGARICELGRSGLGGPLETTIAKTFHILFGFVVFVVVIWKVQRPSKGLQGRYRCVAWRCKTGVVVEIDNCVCWVEKL